MSGQVAKSMRASCVLRVAVPHCVVPMQREDQVSIASLLKFPRVSYEMEAVA